MSVIPAGRWQGAVSWDLAAWLPHRHEG